MSVQRNLEIRNTETYKNMTMVDACMICEDGEHPLDTLLTAWQYIYDNGLHRSLQGFYGRGVQTLLEAGLLLPPQRG